MTMQLISEVTVGAGGAASITFSAIPDTFTDLLLVINTRLAVTGASYAASWVRFNSTTTNYTMRRLYGNGSSAASDSASEIVYNSPNASATSSTFGNAAIYIPNYRSSVAKSISVDSVTENNATQVLLELTAGLWNNTAAITSISLEAIGTTYVQYSSASLYGILAGSDGIVSVS